MRSGKLLHCHTSERSHVGHAFTYWGHGCERTTIWRRAGHLGSKFAKRFVHAIARRVSRINGEEYAAVAYFEGNFDHIDAVAAGIMPVFGPVHR